MVAYTNEVAGNIEAALGGHKHYICLSRGDGTFENIFFEDQNILYQTRVHAQGDFNGDGLTDFLLAQADEFRRIVYPNTAEIFSSNGDGTFAREECVLDISYSAVHAQGDFNGDGKADFFLAMINYLDGSILAPNSTYVYPTYNRTL